ncbi:YlaI family protein [bacterium LRH843]|nr:YlaI family protein [bacterium LRH843]
MRVKCVLCEKIDNLDDFLPLSKKLRNRPIHTYMCEECHDRIAKRTLERKHLESNKLKSEESDWI